MPRIKSRYVTAFASIIITLNFGPVRLELQNQEQQTDLPQVYRLLVEASTEGLESKLNKAADEGFCLEKIAVHPGSWHLVSILKHCPLSADQTRYEYRVNLAENAQQLQQQLDEASRQGWRLHSVHNLVKHKSRSIYVVYDLNIFEKGKGESKEHWSYRAQTFTLKGTFQKRLEENKIEGFYPVEVAYTVEQRLYSDTAPCKVVIFEHSLDASTSIKADFGHHNSEMVAFWLSEIKVENAPFSPGLELFKEIEIKGRGKNFAQNLANEIITQRKNGLQYCGFTFLFQRRVVFRSEPKSGQARLPQYKIISDPHLDDNDIALEQKRLPRLVQPQSLLTPLNESAAAGYQIIDLFRDEDAIVVILERKSNE